jgi:hypothetical protein
MSEGLKGLGGLSIVLGIKLTKIFRESHEQSAPVDLAMAVEALLFEASISTGLPFAAFAEKPIFRISYPLQKDDDYLYVVLVLPPEI